MKAFAGICGMLVLLFAAGDASASGTFDGDLVTDEVVLPDGQAHPTIDAAYAAALAITYDDATNIGCGHFVWSGLSGKPTALHVHLGAAGTNTTTRYSVPLPAGDAVDGEVFFRIQGDAAFSTALAAQGVYGDIHTVKWASGEVRAQLDTDPDNAVDCAQTAPLGLDGTVAGAGTPDASTPTTTSSSASSSSASSSSGTDDTPARTAPGTNTDTASKSSGGCNTTSGTANLSALVIIALGIVALKRKRR